MSKNIANELAADIFEKTLTIFADEDIDIFKKSDTSDLREVIESLVIENTLEIFKEYEIL
jgi:hypothetical protein